MSQRGLLHLPQISRKCSRGLDFQTAIIDAKSRQCRCAELVVEGLAGLIRLEVPGRANRDQRREWPRSMLAQGASTLSSEIKVSAGLSRATRRPARSAAGW